jgi:arginine decarboxylase-like protein
MEVLQTARNVIVTLQHNCTNRNMLKPDILSFAGSILVAIVKYTTKVRSMVKAREARSPDETGIEKTNTLTKLIKTTGTTRFKTNSK